MSEPSVQHVVVAYDYSSSAQTAIDRGIELACLAPSFVLHFIVAIDPRTGVVGFPTDGKVDYDYAERIQEQLSAHLKATFERCQAAGEVQFFVHARIGQPAEEILGLASDVSADFVILGSHGHTGVKRLLLGSVSERVVREAECPVLVARPKAYPPVELQKVFAVPHRPSTYVPPRRYSYAKQVLVRPNDWPLN